MNAPRVLPPAPRQRDTFAAIDEESLGAAMLAEATAPRYKPDPVQAQSLPGKVNRFPMPGSTASKIHKMLKDEGRPVTSAEIGKLMGIDPRTVHSTFQTWEGRCFERARAPMFSKQKAFLWRAT